MVLYSKSHPPASRYGTCVGAPDHLPGLFAHPGPNGFRPIPEVNDKGATRLVRLGSRPETMVRKLGVCVFIAQQAGDPIRSQARKRSIALGWPRWSAWLSVGQSGGPDSSHRPCHHTAMGCTAVVSCAGRASQINKTGAWGWRVPIASGHAPPAPFSATVRRSRHRRTSPPRSPGCHRGRCRWYPSGTPSPRCRYTPRPARRPRST